jgi:hypothetical protein
LYAVFIEDLLQDLHALCADDGTQHTAHTHTKAGG